MHRTLSRAISLALALAISGAGTAASAQESGTQNQSAAASPSNSSATPVELPDSPGKVNAGSSSAPQGNSTASSAQTAQSSQPTGTAVAPPVQVSGGAASKPAGVAIAPPKQRRTRSLLIKFGFIVGAGAALGTVAALSAASPGHVPGSTGH
jgi:cytoskeletal protein RodZ